MDNGNLSRRGFLGRFLGGMAAAGLPAWHAQEMFALAQQESNAQPSANDRINIGVIGTGTNHTRRTGDTPLRGERGVYLLREAMGKPGVRIVAVCDVDRTNRDYAANIVGEGCRKYEDFRELLRQQDIDAVIVGTPDHWHALIAAAAMKAGKHVYCEKPLTLTLDEGRMLVRVQRETNKTLQTGSQQRTEFNGRFRLAVELVRNGRIGRVNRITTLIGSNPTGGPFRVQEPPEGLNWDFWLGPTPQVPYSTERCHYEFRWWYDYSGGKMTDWGAHHNDIAQWALNMDESGPIQVYGSGQKPDQRPNCYNCHPQFQAVYTYGNGPNGAAGTQLVCRSEPPQGWSIRNGEGQVQNNGVLFEGENKQWIFVGRGVLLASNAQLIDEALPQNATRLGTATNQMANFLECMRSGQRPACHVGVGHRSVSVCHIGTIAIRLGRGQDRPLRWNPQEERFTGDDDANAMLSRPYRAPWRLEA